MITETVTKMELLAQVKRELKDPMLVLNQHYYYDPGERYCHACAIGVFYRALNSLTCPVLNETPARIRNLILDQLRPVFSTSVITSVEKLFRVRYEEQGDQNDNEHGDPLDPMNRPILSTIVDMMMEMEGDLDYDTVLEALNELGLGE